jgi:hypothetical protein
MPTTPKRIRVSSPATIVGVFPRYTRPLMAIPLTPFSVWNS